MVQPIIDEQRQHDSMSRCPEYEGCECELCPLDPYLKLKVFIPGKPLCPWYKRLTKKYTVLQIPPVVLDKLPIYQVFLLHSGLFKAAKTDSPR